MDFFFSLDLFPLIVFVLVMLFKFIRNLLAEHEERCEKRKK